MVAWRVVLELVFATTAYAHSQEGQEMMFVFASLHLASHMKLPQVPVKFWVHFLWMVALKADTNTLGNNFHLVLVEHINI